MDELLDTLTYFVYWTLKVSEVLNNSLKILTKFL